MRIILDRKSRAFSLKSGQGKAGCLLEGLEGESLSLPSPAETKENSQVKQINIGLAEKFIWVSAFFH